MEATRTETGSNAGKHRHMMNLPKLLINLLYRALAQSSGIPGWNQLELKKPWIGWKNQYC